MEKKKLMFRQGDILLKEIEKIPTAAVRSKTNVLAEGEGHHQHEVYGDVDVLELNDEMYLSVNEDGVLEHNHIGSRNKADHDSINLPPGLYEVVYQRGYDPYKKAAERVRD